MGRFNRQFLEAFQVDDVAKLCMKGGGVLSWEQGLGKTIGALLAAKTWGDQNVLVIAPQDLVPQWRKSAADFFTTDLRPIRGVRDAIRLRERMKRGGLTGYYITYYEALAQAGKVEEYSHVHWNKCMSTRGIELKPAMFGRKLPVAADFKDQELRTDKLYKQKDWPHARALTELNRCPQCGMIGETQDWIVNKGHMVELDGHPISWRTFTRDLFLKHGRDSIKVAMELKADKRLKALTKSRRKRKVLWDFRQAKSVNGPRVRNAVCSRCGYVHWSTRLKPAYYWLRDLFDCIIVDEGTKIKNMDSQTSQAIQGMKARHRLLLTGTPIKNYITDAFALMWWAMGNNSPRFPFSRDTGRAKFEEEYAVIEHTLGDRGQRMSRKVLPQVSNLISFWRLAGAGCIRRTKANIPGIDIVPCTWHELKAPFGTRQAAAYGFWLENFVSWFIEKHPDSGISQYPNLIDRSKGILGAFAKLQFMCTLPEAEPDRWVQEKGLHVSNYTPKNVAVIRKAMELVDDGRKLVIFSAVKEHSCWIADILNHLNYPTLSIVEDKGGKIVTMGPKGRANLVRDFIEDGYPILCASIQAMNLGHNLDCASALIINGLPWDFASFDQAINRVHRITSKRAVDIFVAQSVCNPHTNDFRNGASLDQKMRQLVKDKGESAELALDGKIKKKEVQNVDLESFLQELTEQWKEPVDTLDEESLRVSLIESLAA